MIVVQVALAGPARSARRRRRRSLLRRLLLSTVRVRTALVARTARVAVAVAVAVGVEPGGVAERVGALLLKRAAGFVRKRQRQSALAPILVPARHRVDGELAVVGVWFDELRARVARQQVGHQDLPPLVHVHEHAADFAEVPVYQVHAVGAHLLERRHRGGEHERRAIAEHRLDDLHQLVLSRLVQAVHLGDGVRRRLAHVRRDVHRALSDGQNHNRNNHVHADGGHDSERQRSDARVGVREIFLERVDGQQRLVRLLLRGAHQVDVHQHLHLERILRQIHHHRREKLRHVAAGGHHPDEPFQPIQLLARHGTAQRLVQLAALLLDLRATKRKGRKQERKSQSSLEGVGASETTQTRRNAPPRRSVVSRAAAPRGNSPHRGRGSGRRSPVTRGSARRDSPAAGSETRGRRGHADRRAVRPPPRLLDADSTARPDVRDGERIALHPRAGTRRVETERRETHLRVIGVVTRHRARVDDTERCVSTQPERRARGTGEWRSHAGRGWFSSFPPVTERKAFSRKIL